MHSARTGSVRCTEAMQLAFRFSQVYNILCVHLLIGLAEILEKMKFCTWKFASYVFGSKIQLFWFKTILIRKNRVLSLAENTKDFQNS